MKSARRCRLLVRLPLLLVGFSCRETRALHPQGLVLRGSTSLSTSSNDDKEVKADEVRRQMLLQQAADLAARAGVTDLCHPVRDNLPGFPLCNNNNDPSEQRRTTKHSNSYNGNNGKPTRHEERRGLEQEDERDFYYDYDDDKARYYTNYEEPPKKRWFYIYNVLGASFCVVAGALVAGIMIGLLSLDPLLLLIKARASDCPLERAQASAILPIVKQHHLLLVALLLLNTLASEALPLYLGQLVPDAVAVILSVLLVLFCGEILPTAYFTGRNQVKMAAKWVNFTKFLLCITYPIAYPIARLLDFLVGGGDEEHEDGKGGSVFNRNELAALIRIQYEERLAAKRRRKKAGGDIDSMTAQQLHELKVEMDRQSSSFHQDEVAIVEGAMQMKTRCAVDLLKSYRKVFSVSYNTMLDEAAIVRIFTSGYSRIPVYEGNKKKRIKGILMSRQLIMANKNDPRPISSLPLHIPHCVAPETNLVELVNLFQTGGSVRRAGHMALVCARPDLGNAALEDNGALPDEAGLIGIITLEDVLEAILSAQILDEMDAAGRINMIDSVDSEDNLEDANCVYHLHCAPMNAMDGSFT